MCYVHVSQYTLSKSQHAQVRVDRVQNMESMTIGYRYIVTASRYMNTLKTIVAVFCFSILEHIFIPSSGYL